MAERPAYKKALVAFLDGAANKLCKNCQRRIHTNPLRVLDCKVQLCRSLTDTAPAITDFLSIKSRNHFDGVLAGLTSLKIPYVLNPRLVRGLDYYSMTTFEVSCSLLGSQNAIAAGGRYDGLFQALGGKPTPAVGFAVGLERVVLSLPKSLELVSRPLVFVASFGSSGLAVGLSLLDSLRSGGIMAVTDYDVSSLKGLLRAADRLGAMYTIIVGDDEISKNSAIIRNMQSKEQELIPLDAVFSHMVERISLV